MVSNTDPNVIFQVTKPPYKVSSAPLEISNSYRFGDATNLLVVDMRTYKQSGKRIRGISDCLISIYNSDIGKLVIDPERISSFLHIFLMAIFSSTGFIYFAVVVSSLRNYRKIENFLSTET